MPAMKELLYLKQPNNIYKSFNVAARCTPVNTNGLLKQLISEWALTSRHTAVAQWKQRYISTAAP